MYSNFNLKNNEDNMNYGFQKCNHPYDDDYYYYYNNTIDGTNSKRVKILLKPWPCCLIFLIDLDLGTVTTVMSLSRFTSRFSRTVLTQCRNSPFSVHMSAFTNQLSSSTGLCDKVLLFLFLLVFLCYAIDFFSPTCCSISGSIISH